MFDKKKRPEASVANYFKKLCVKLPGSLPLKGLRSLLALRRLSAREVRKGFNYQPDEAENQ